MYRQSGRTPPQLRPDTVKVPEAEEAGGSRPTSAYVPTCLRIVPLCACLAFASVGVRNWLPTFFASKEFPYYSVLFMNAMDLVGNLIGAWGADRFGCAVVIVAGFAGSAASTLPLITYESLACRTLLGGVQQCMQGLVWVSLGTLSCEVFPTRCRGLYMGVIFIVITLCTSAAPVVGGYYFAQGVEASESAISVYGFTYLAGAFGSVFLLFDIPRVDVELSKTATKYGATDSTGEQNARLNTD
jgi:hypothetical protein